MFPSTSIHRFVVCFLVALSGTYEGRCDETADRLAKKYPVLARLTPSKEELPPKCQILEIPNDIPELKGLKNLAITVEPKHFLIADKQLQDIIDAKMVQAAYFAIYREGNELGVMGWAFASAEDAKVTHQKLSETYGKDQERFRLWQVDQHVVWLWRDSGTSNSCFESFERFLNAKLKKPEASSGNQTSGNK